MVALTRTPTRFAVLHAVAHSEVGEEFTGGEPRGGHEPNMEKSVFPPAVRSHESESRPLPAAEAHGDDGPRDQGVLNGARRWAALRRDALERDSIPRQVCFDQLVADEGAGVKKSIHLLVDGAQPPIPVIPVHRNDMSLHVACTSLRVSVRW
jgi:hypothetical protein